MEFTLFLIITLNSNPDYPDQKSLMGGISSHEIGTFEYAKDCLTQATNLTAVLESTDGYVVEYKCLPTKYPVYKEGG
tara:strand:+ start:369 stop:599 length:231 start_codon:yes stop_codon:yes gene_type:complete